MQLKKSQEADIQKEYTTIAIYLSIFSVFYNIAEGVVSIVFGEASDSISLFFFGIQSFVEVMTACIVLWKITFIEAPKKKLNAEQLRREKYATIIIGILFIILSLGTIIDGILALAFSSHPTTTISGIIISVIATTIMLFLWLTKRKVARVLNSSTIQGDANCSLACIQITVLVFIGSIIYEFWKGGWWIDAVVALILGVLFGKEGVESIKWSMSKEFDGGCCGGCRVQMPADKVTGETVPEKLLHVEKGLARGEKKSCCGKGKCGDEKEEEDVKLVLEIKDSCGMRGEECCEMKEKGKEGKGVVVLEKDEGNSVCGKSCSKGKCSKEKEKSECGEKACSKSCSKGKCSEKKEQTTEESSCSKACSKGKCNEEKSSITTEASACGKSCTKGKCSEKIGQATKNVTPCEKSCTKGKYRKEKELATTEAGSCEKSCAKEICNGNKAPEESDKAPEEKSNCAKSCSKGKYNDEKESTASEATTKSSNCAKSCSKGNCNKDKEPTADDTKSEKECFTGKCTKTDELTSEGTKRKSSCGGKTCCLEKSDATTVYITKIEKSQTKEKAQAKEKAPCVKRKCNDEKPKAKEKIDCSESEGNSLCGKEKALLDDDDAEKVNIKASCCSESKCMKEQEAVGSKIDLCSKKKHCIEEEKKGSVIATAATTVVSEKSSCGKAYSKEKGAAAAREMVRERTCSEAEDCPALVENSGESKDSKDESRVKENCAKGKCSEEKCRDNCCGERAGCVLRVESVLIAT